MGNLRMVNDFALVRKNRLVKNLLVVEGPTRAGKFLLADFLNGIEGVEGAQYYGLFEHLPYLEELGFLKRETAIAILQCQIDNFCYDWMVGRTLNFRFDDKSSVYRSPHLKKYMQRCLEPDGDVIVRKITEQGMYFPFIIHDALRNIKIFLEAFPSCKVVRIERNPIDLAYSWFNRGWGQRWGVDPKDFSMTFARATFSDTNIDSEGAIPWFAYNWAGEYESSSEMDRVIKSLYYLHTKGKETYNSLPELTRQKIHFLTYEQILTDTDNMIRRLASFLGKEISPQLRMIKAKENCPTTHPKLVRQDKIDKIKSLATEENFNLLMEMDREYRIRWSED